MRPSNEARKDSNGMELAIYLLEYIRTRKNWERVLPWLEDSLFPEDDTKDTFRAITKAMKYEHCKVVDYPQILSLNKEMKKDPDRWDDVVKVCRLMAKARKKSAVVATYAKKFLVSRQVLSILQETADAVGEGEDVNVGKLKLHLSKLESIGDSEGLVTDMFVDPAKRLQDFEQSSGKPVPTPIPQLTELLDGGPGGGDAVTVIALPDGGKTQLLLDVAATASEHGFNTFVAVLERGRVCTSRMDCRITNHTARWLYAHPKRFVRIMRNKASKNAPLRIMDYSRKEVSISDLRRDIAHFIDDYGGVGCIVIDYGDLVRSSRHYEAPRFELDLVWKEISRMSQEFNCPVWTATQSNRKGMDVSMLSMGNVAEAFAKMGTADIVLTLNRTEKEKQLDQGRIFLAKTKKTGGSAIIPVKMDRLRCRVRPLLDEDRRKKRNAHHHRPGYQEGKKSKGFGDRKTILKRAIRATSQEEDDSVEAG
jgi:replicative DNA helicase